VAAVCGAILPFVAGCAYYSFTGATIPSHLSTIAIPLVEDATISTITSMDEEMTALLVDRFVGQTRLSLQPDETQSDVLLRARIERYANQPTSVGGQERATLNRVTISVSAEYIDRTRDETLFTRSFSAFEEYDPAVDGLEGEEKAASAILEQIADDIFTAATSNW
jgi:hypothetical protein